MPISLSKTRSTAALSLAISLQLAAGATSPANAQTELEGIVVEGVSLGGDEVPVEKTGASVSVVTGEQLQQRQIRHAGDALRSLPGVSVSRTGSVGGLTQVRIRGAEGNHTLVLIDGIEANDTGNGEFNFSDLDVENIERIEVIRGPQSGLYGSKALGGVINIVTRSGQGPLQIKAKVENGTFDTTNTSFNVSGGDDVIFGSFNLSRQSTNGFNIAPEGRETDETKKRTIAFKGGVRPYKFLLLDVVARISDKTAGSDPEGPGAGLLPVLFDRQDFSFADVRLAGAGATLELFDGHWIHEFRGNVNETKREFMSPTFFSRNDGKSRQSQYLSTLKFDTPGLARGKHKLTGLWERENQEFNPVTQDNVTRDREIESYAADYFGEFFDILSLQGAVRHDDFDVFGEFDTWRAAASLKVPGTTVRLHGSAGTGVKAPTMFEQFGQFPGFFVPNPDLTQEESFGWDAGAEISMFQGRAVVDVTWFEADLENKIAPNPNAVFGVDPSLINLAGISERQGLEIAGRVRITNGLSIGGAYTMLSAKDPDGAIEIRRAKHAGRFDANYKFAGDKGNLNAAVVYNGEMDDLPFVPVFPFGRLRVTLDDYVVVNFAGSYEVKRGIELFGRVENAFDEDYQEIFAYGTAGVAAYGGIRLTFGGDNGIIQ